MPEVYEIAVVQPDGRIYTANIHDVPDQLAELRSELDADSLIPERGWVGDEECIFWLVPRTPEAEPNQSATDVRGKPTFGPMGISYEPIRTNEKDQQLIDMFLAEGPAVEF